MKTLSYLALLIALAVASLTVVSSCSESPQEAPPLSDKEAPIVSPGLPPAPPGPDQTLPEPSDRWSPDGIIGDNEYLGEMRYGDYEIYWMTDRQNAYFGIKAKTKGWVAIGFNPSSRMKDADIIFGLVRDGQATVSDQYSTGTYGPHAPDIELGGSDDITEFSGREEGEFTIIEFTRALVTGDAYDNELPRGPIKIIWSYGSIDDIGQKHIARGSGEIQL